MTKVDIIRDIIKEGEEIYLFLLFHTTIVLTNDNK